MDQDIAGSVKLSASAAAVDSSSSAARSACTLGGCVVLFSFTLFLSAFLLFSVQPMVGKMILPMLGGAPAVWTSCMVFFQAALLAGYAYAHFASRILPTRLQVFLHVVLLALPFMVLPIRIAQDAGPSSDVNPAFWLLARLIAEVGLPFLLVASTAPLLQRWFAQLPHPDAEDPYFLYALSNAGSLLALLAYPFIIEPALSVQSQSRGWTFCYGALAAMILGCAIVSWRAVAHPPAQSVSLDRAVPSGRDLTRPTMRRRLRWVLLALVPSSLMLGVTSYITTDLAAVPLLWVLPLALYLLTFAFTFARRPPFKPRSMALALAIALPVWMITPVRLDVMNWILIPLHLLLFFVAAMICHGRLAADRPSKEHLTEFYLWISVGGVLGGLFNALVAPAVFVQVVEYPLMLVTACLLRPNLAAIKHATRERLLDFLIPAALVGAGCIGVLLGGAEHKYVALTGKLITFAALPAVCFLHRARSLRFGLSMGAFLLCFGLFANRSFGRTIDARRNFFGVKRVSVSDGGAFHKLVHGGTAHGIQSTDPNRRAEPLGYYHREGPLNDIFAAFNSRPENKTVAIIGLGTGGMAAYAKSGQQLTFFEIDPQVADIAANPRFFTFLRDSAGQCSCVIGDGRLMLARSEQKFDLIILDAFSSDAIPTHLLSREAIHLYLSKLNLNGFLALHLSNRYLDLAPVAENLARDAGLVCMVRRHSVGQEEAKSGQYPSIYAALARSPEVLDVMMDDLRWRRGGYDTDAPLWTDRYCGLFSVFKWR